ncbi:peptidylprolyl isomerase [Gaetbulibacter aestuarii]|uniref:peptidylprolyl isomerase n=1 Tax=Gaetbulibacter aestuarii TaxID=1502358 RepID=A0ABW7MWU0_9FLAO
MVLSKPVFRVLGLLLVLNLSACKAQYPDLKDGLYAEFVTNKGTMLAELYYKKAPATVANFVSLAEGDNPLADSIYKGKKFYNGLLFHRVVKDFVIQGGDPTGTGKGGPGYKFNDEFSPDLKHDKKGILAMANSGYNTNGSQFYITLKETPWLNAYDEDGILKPCENSRISCHTVFGEIIKGLQVIDTIEQKDTIEEVNIIRKGSEAKNFDAPEVFLEALKKAERQEKEKAEKEAALLRSNKEKFEKQKEKAVALPSGLKYFISKKGNGPKLNETSDVLAHYSLYFENGKLLETSELKTAEANNMVNEQRKEANGYQPINCDLSPDAQMIAGFKEGLRQLSVGDRATLFIPYYLAYGEYGMPGIPPKTNLIFVVEVTELIN